MFDELRRRHLHTASWQLLVMVPSESGSARVYEGTVHDTCFSDVADLFIPDIACNEPHVVLCGWLHDTNPRCCSSRLMHAVSSREQPTRYPACVKTKLCPRGEKGPPEGRVHKTWSLPNQTKRQHGTVGADIIEKACVCS